MNHPQRCITVLHCLHNNPDCKQIIYLIQGLVLVYHLFVNAEEMLHSSVYPSFNPGLADMSRHLVYNTLYKGFSGILTQGNLLCQIIINLRLQILQRKIIQLHLNFRNTKPVCNGRINVHRFTGLFLLLLRLHILKSTHIVKAVRQLNQNHADILGHGQEHLPQILSLNLHLIHGPGQLGQLCNSVYQKSYLCAELLLHLVQSHNGILYHIMKNSGNDGFFIQLQIRQNNGNTKRVNNIRFTRLPLLVLMGLSGDSVCFFYLGNIIRRMVLPDTFDQILIQYFRTGKVRRILQFNIHSRFQLFFCHRKATFLYA